jgi:hypothetical protein
MATPLIVAILIPTIRAGRIRRPDSLADLGLRDVNERLQRDRDAEVLLLEMELHVCSPPADRRPSCQTAHPCHYRGNT